METQIIDGDLVPVYDTTEKRAKPRDTSADKLFNECEAIKNMIKGIQDVIVAQEDPNKAYAIIERFLTHIGYSRRVMRDFNYEMAKERRSMK